MSLNWEFKDKSRFDKLTDEEKKLNNSFIWGCMFIDMGDITEKNYREWHARYLFANRAIGPFYHTENMDGKMVSWEPSLSQVEARIGLHTNVTTLSRKQFFGKVGEVALENILKEEANG